MKKKARRRRPHFSSNLVFDRFDELQFMPDQAVALVCHAIVERALEGAIATRLRRLTRAHYQGLFGKGRPFFSYAAKVRIGHALALFGQTTLKELVH